MTRVIPVKRLAAGVLLGLLLGLTTVGPMIAQDATPPATSADGNVDQDMRAMMEQCTAMMRMMMGMMGGTGGMMGDQGMAGMSGMMGGTEPAATPSP